MNTEERLKELVDMQLGVEADMVGREARFVEDLGADTLDVAELILDTEEEFGICILESDMNDITTFGKLVDYVETAIQRQR